MERSFTSDIRQFAGHGPAMLTGREEHNASSPTSIMLRREYLRQQQGRAHIRMQMPIYFGRCEVFEASQGAVGVVYDQDVNVTKGDSSRTDQRFRCVGNLEVGIFMLDAHALASQFID
jgi:hypothetical protein